MLEKYPNDIRYVIKHFPLPNHSFAHQGAMAALAAGKQGKFWEFHSQLLENHQEVNDQKLAEIAGNLNLNMEQFNQDRQSTASRQLIQGDVENGRSIGVRGTPTVFINGKRVKSRDDLLELIRRELAK